MERMREYPEDCQQSLLARHPDADVWAGRFADMEALTRGKEVGEPR